MSKASSISASSPFPFHAVISVNQNGKCPRREIIGRILHGKGCHDAGARIIPCKLWEGDLPAKEALEVHSMGNPEQVANICSVQCVFACVG